MFVPLVQKEPDHHFVLKGECVLFTFTNKRTKHDILNASYNKGERNRVTVSRSPLAHKVIRLHENLAIYYGKFLALPTANQCRIKVARGP